MKKIILSIVCAMGVIALNAETFNKVTDAATLADGDKVILACEASNAVSAGFKTGTGANKYLSYSDASFLNGVATVTSPTYLDLHKSGNYWTFTLGGKPIGNKTGSNDFDTEKKTTANFTIAIDGEGYATIVSQNKGENNANVQFYCNSSNKAFRLYSSTTQNKIQLYKLDESSVPEVVPTKVELDKESAEVRIGETLTLSATVTPTNAADKSVTWGSLNTSIATVSEGTVTPVAVGTTKIWVKTTKGENVTDTCVVTILPAIVQGNATYKAVQKADYLTAGAKVFFGTIKENENYVMGRYVSGNNIKGVDANYGESRHAVTAALQYAYTVEKDGNYYLFVDQDGKYLRTISSSKLGNGTEADDYAKWTLGEFDQDDATVVLTNKGNSKGLFNNWQGNNDMFNIYEGVGDGSYLAKTVLYSSEAPDWVEREKHPSMVVSGDDLTIENGQYVLDWGKQEMDEYSKDWGDSRKFTVTITDLSDDVEVSLQQTGETFRCGWVDAGIKKTRTEPAEITVFWDAEEKGVYTGKLTFHTETAGVNDIVVNLRAEAVDQSSDPAFQPSFSVSEDTLVLNPNKNDNDFYDLQSFTFTAKNLAKTLYCKWEHTSSVLFNDVSENEMMEILVGSDELGLNENLHLDADQDYEDEDVLVEVDGLTTKGTYKTKLHFYSYKKDSKTELAIDKSVIIYIKVTDDPDISIPVETTDPTDPDPTDPDPTDPDPQDPGNQAIDDVNAQVQVQKIVRDGRVLILRKGEVYSVTGERL